MKAKTSIILLTIAFFLSHCNAIKKPKIDTTYNPNVSPFYTAKEAIKKMEVEDGFEVKLVAAEPLISTPVAMSFDHKGRIWAVEMTGYMPDTLGTGEDIPNGKIVILEDKNKDGLYDTRKIFLDSLVLPRAICLIEGGILVAESPKLWYYKIVNDKPVGKTLVDAKYAEGGNVEHQPNGLLRALDNWIYNAKSTKRYRKNGEQWLIETTHFRGQWGINQDDYGRLYYNSNSQNLAADYFAPGFGSNNKDQNRVAGFDEDLIRNNRVYPLRPTPGVNRGYMDGILDDSLRLVNFTAACGPLVYRGHIFGENYLWNAFVAEPSANLIKRNILEEKGYITAGRQAYKNTEFIRSTDERFRPVNLYNAPDGAMYIVDMYRGIIQHITYLTPYLKNQIDRRNLTLPLQAGRIYKVLPKNNKTKIIELPDDPAQLVSYLGHSNGWIRDQAQQMLVDSKTTHVIPELQNALKSTNTFMVIHALWTLEGLHALSSNDVLSLMQSPTWPIRMQALSAAPSIINESNYKAFTAGFQERLNMKDDLAAPYIAFALNQIKAFDANTSEALLFKLAQLYPNNAYVSDAIISNLHDREDLFLKKLSGFVPDTSMAIQKKLKAIVTARLKARANRDPQLLAREFPKGAVLFKSTCQACHGADGNGINALAPPLNQSEWVTGDKENLSAIVLYGLTGPVEVNGHLYKAPEIAGEMPGLNANKDISDDEVAQVLSYIRKAWLNNAEKITPEEVKNVRNKYQNRQKPFTVEELQ
jgi:putative membrane-bound dehydrogenase-like protein